MQTDVASLQGSLRTTSTTAYTLHEIQISTGTVVREYVSPSGKVFAVTWQGPWIPDLKQLLGSYFPQLQEAVQSSKPHPGRAPVSIRQANLVVQQAGHMRSFFGRAYLLDQLPSGVTEDAIR